MNYSLKFAVNRDIYYKSLTDLVIYKSFVTIWNQLIYIKIFMKYLQSIQPLIDFL